jgi:perosamine synthetase
MKRSPLAIDGGEPIRTKLLPYGRQSIDESDVAAVVAALRSDFLTTGPRVAAFERAFAERHASHHAVAVSNGTAALHITMAAFGFGPGDEVLVTPLTFAASANAVLYVGATPKFVDVEADTLLLDPVKVRAAITPRTRAIVAVDYAGHPADYDSLSAIASQHGLKLIADACHATGATYRGRSVGTLADASCFSFHPVKTITTGEGGLVTTADPAFAGKLRRLRHHGIDIDANTRSAMGSWVYEMVELGWNYRLTDVQCALGSSQLERLDGWLSRRRAIAAEYDRAFMNLELARPLAARDHVEHGRHLYVLQLAHEQLRGGRASVFAALRAEGIGVNVHYLPVHLHPYYRQTLGTGPGLCPVAEQAYEGLVSLPLFPAMTDADVADVVAAVSKVLQALAL